MSLNQHKTPSIIAAEIHIERNVRDCAFLLVEGADDGRFWGSRIGPNCSLLIAGGRRTNVNHPEPVSMGWLRPPRYIDKSLSIDRTRLDRDAVSNGLASDAVSLHAALATLQSIDIWNIAQGHDLVDIVTLALKGLLGDIPANRGRSDVASALRLAAETEQLQQSAMWAGILAWQDAAQPYFVLPTTRSNTSG